MKLTVHYHSKHRRRHASLQNNKEKGTEVEKCKVNMHFSQQGQNWNWTSRLTGIKGGNKVEAQPGIKYQQESSMRYLDQLETGR